MSTIDISEELDTPVRRLQRSHPTQRRFRLSNDALNMVKRSEAARVAFKGIDLVHNEMPEAQVAGLGMLFLTFCEKNRCDPREALQRCERIMASRHDVSERRANQYLDALNDYIEHLYDPSRGHPTG